MAPHPNFFPLPTSVNNLWRSVPNPNYRVPDHPDRYHAQFSMRNLDVWQKLANERAQHIAITATWRDAAIADGWAMTPTYTHEDWSRACTLKRDGCEAHILTRSNRPELPELPPENRKDDGKLNVSLGTGEVTVWGSDRLQIPVPRIYPGWQYFQDALVTCPHCHRGPNARYFALAAAGPLGVTTLLNDPNLLEIVSPVTTSRYSFAGRACEQCAPALRAATEQPGWND